MSIEWCRECGVHQRETGKRNYLELQDRAARARARGRMEGMTGTLEFAEGASTARSIREHLRALIAAAECELEGESDEQG